MSDISFVTQKQKQYFNYVLFVFCFSREKKHFDCDLLRKKNRGRRGRDHMVVRTTYAISADVVSSNLDQGEVYNSM